jgi:hypothetical protein
VKYLTKLLGVALLIATFLSYLLLLYGGPGIDWRELHSLWCSGILTFCQILSFLRAHFVVVEECQVNDARGWIDVQIAETHLYSGPPRRSSQNGLLTTSFIFETSILMIVTRLNGIADPSTTPDETRQYRKVRPASIFENWQPSEQHSRPGI